MTTPPATPPAFVQCLDSAAADVRVLQEHIAILREIKAPEELISVAMRVAEATLAANQKK
jgi:hypothetical protein